MQNDDESSKEQYLSIYLCLPFTSRGVIDCGASRGTSGSALVKVKHSHPETQSHLHFTTMLSLTELIREIPATEEDSPEDIFASAPGFLFTDDLRNQHGDPGSIIVYKSERFGEISLTTADPNGEEERTLFSHYLWNAGILMAERVSGQRLLNHEEERQWSVKGHDVLELGAGAG